MVTIGEAEGVGGSARAVSGAAPLGEPGPECGGVVAGESPGEKSTGVPLPEQGGVSKGLPPKPSPKPSPPPTHPPERSVSRVAAEPTEGALPAGEASGDSAPAGGGDVALWPCRPPGRRADHHCWLLRPPAPS